MSKAPEICLYCKGTGYNLGRQLCGFCIGGVPLDTQEDWDETWGRLHKRLEEMRNEGKETSTEDR